MNARQQLQCRRLDRGARAVDRIRIAGFEIDDVVVRVPMPRAVRCRCGERERARGDALRSVRAFETRQLARDIRQSRRRLSTGVKSPCCAAGRSPHNDTNLPYRIMFEYSINVPKNQALHAFFRGIF